jgi:hypothetical protein
VQNNQTAAIQSEWLTRQQAAQFINMSVAWIRKQERAGHGCERVRAGKCVRYTRDALHRWMQQRAEQ